MSKLQWTAILVAGLTAFGISYFVSAVHFANSPVETVEPTETVENIAPETPSNKTETPSKKPTQQPSTTPPSTNTKENPDKKGQCGNGTCTTPETTNNCPVDCE